MIINSYWALAVSKRFFEEEPYLEVEVASYTGARTDTADKLAKWQNRLNNIGSCNSPAREQVASALQQVTSLSSQAKNVRQKHLLEEAEMVTQKVAHQTDESLEIQMLLR